MLVFLSLNICQVASVVSDSVRPHRRQPTRLPRPWHSPGKNTGVGCHFLLQCMKVKSKSEVTQSCPTLSDPMDRSLLGSSIHGIFQTRVLEWGAIAFSDLPSLASLQTQGKQNRALVLSFCQLWRWLTPKDGAPLFYRKSQEKLRHFFCTCPWYLAPGWNLLQKSYRQ